MLFNRGLLVLSICIVLQSCSYLKSPKMSQELLLGKATFERGYYKSAFCQLLPVAVYGRREAQYAVGYMYYYGFGTARNPESGIFWMTKAAEQCYGPAIKALELIRNQESDCPSDYTAVEEEITVKKPCKVYKEEIVRPSNRDEVIETIIQKRPIEPVVVKPAFIPPPKLSSSENYTLQLFGAFNLENVKNLQKDLALTKKTSIYRSQNQGKDWYVLTHGKYASAMDAREANKKLPEDVKDLDPWVRKFEGLKMVG